MHGSTSTFACLSGAARRRVTVGLVLAVWISASVLTMAPVGAEPRLAIEGAVLLEPPTDLNGDELPDLLIGLMESQTAAVVYNRGDFEWSEPVAVASGGASALGDVDGDGDSDLLTAEGPNVQLHRNDGDGVFASPVAAASLPPAVGNIGLTDLDGDRQLDLLITEAGAVGRAFSLTGLGDGAFSQPELLLVATRGVPSAADLDGAAPPDLVVTSNFSGADFDVAVVLRDGDRRSRHRLASDTEPLIRTRDDGRDEVVGSRDGALLHVTGNGARVRVSETPLPAGAGVLLAAGDADGDGLLDALVRAQAGPGFVVDEVALVRDVEDVRGVGAALEPLEPGGGPYVDSAHFVDLDRRNGVDLITEERPINDLLIRGLANDGTGRFTAEQVLAPECLPDDQWEAPRSIFDDDLPVYEAVAADVDGDAVLDVVTAGGSVLWSRGEGGGSFGTVTRLGPRAFSSGSGQSRYAVPFDLEGDGDTDVAAVGFEYPASAVYEYTGEDFVERLLDVGPYTGSVTAGDLDEDGDADLLAGVWNIERPSEVLLLENLGAGAFAEPRVVARLATGGVPHQLLLTELTGDGIRDLVIATATEERIGEVFLARGIAQGFSPSERLLRTSTESGLTTNYPWVALGDLYGDARGELVVSTFGEPLRAFELDPDGRLGQPRMLDPFSHGRVVTVDFDGDGDTDVYAGGRCDWLENRGGGELVPRSMPGGGGVPVDLDDDGDLDVLMPSQGGGGAEWVPNLRRGEHLPPTLAVRRLGGSSRIDTAVVISEHRFPDGVDDVVLAGSSASADALVAGRAASARGAPLLLTDGDWLSIETAAELDRLRPARVEVVGGSAVIPDAVVDEVRRLLPDARVVRSAGAERFATAAVIAGATPSRGTVDLASGYSLADALAAAPIDGGVDPLALVARDELPEATADVLRRLAPSRVRIFGGEAAIDPGVVAQIQEVLPSVEVVRYAGAERTETAAMVAEAFFQGADTAVLAAAYSGADALVAGPLAAAEQAPVLLVAGSEPGSATERLVDELDIRELVVIGGELAVSEGAVQDLVDQSRGRG